MCAKCENLFFFLLTTSNHQFILGFSSCMLQPCLTLLSATDTSWSDTALQPIDHTPSPLPAAASLGPPILSARCFDLPPSPSLSPPSFSLTAVSPVAALVAVTHFLLPAHTCKREPGAGSRFFFSFPNCLPHCFFGTDLSTTHTFIFHGLSSLLADCFLMEYK